MAEGLVVGVDGGATKTRAAVIGPDGRMLGYATAASSSAYHREPEEAAAVVITAVRQALATAGRPGPAAALGAGLAGADDPALRVRLLKALGDARLARAVTVEHDAAAALAGGLALEPGVVVIAGTGSVAFGTDASGRRARAGGWGPLLDDEGSGHAIGRAVLRAAMRAHDGRGEPTALAEAVAHRYGLASLAALKVAVRGIGIHEVAAVAPLAADAARAGDAVATVILDHAGQGLAAMVAAVARALDWQRVAFPLVLSGGVFNAGEAIRQPLVRALFAHGCAPHLLAPRFPPEVGAALLAARAAGIDPGALFRGLSARAGDTGEGASP
jgi:N-acetylglucosamine kinase-like BadF-type ATPase